jgi:uridine phosphorylase
MEYHIKCDPQDIARYVFCPGDQARARKIAEYFSDQKIVSEDRGYLVISGTYEGELMTVIGTGMGGPVVAIGLEELAHMGADTFIRVGSCGVFQKGQNPGDVIIASGTFRAGGTANAYLPLGFPAVPTFEVMRKLVEAAEGMNVAARIGVGLAGDSFYGPRDADLYRKLVDAGIISVEMESDTLFVIGAYRGWRTGALYASDGTPDEIKPKWGEARYREGEQNCIKIALRAMRNIIAGDKSA